jgi:hypothetical protein
MRAIRLAAASCLLAGAAWAGFGSVISSFRVAEPGGAFGRAAGIYRDGSYVYCIAMKGDTEYLCRYTPQGSLVSTIKMANVFYVVGDAEACHLGSGYFAVGDRQRWRVNFINKFNGAVVKTLEISGPGGADAGIVVYNGWRYYIGSRGSMGEYRVYTPAGSFVRNWWASGWPATMDGTGGATFADCALGRDGKYLVASKAWGTGASCIINMNDGSLVRMWSDAPLRITGAAYGKSSRPAIYGYEYWVIHEELNVYTAREVDLAAGHPAVVPASIGRIKAVYR